MSGHDSNAVEENGENNDQDPPIDPMMLKYMEMIQQRREAENKVYYHRYHRTKLAYIYYLYSYISTRGSSILEIAN